MFVQIVASLLGTPAKVVQFKSAICKILVSTIAHFLYGVKLILCTYRHVQNKLCYGSIRVPVGVMNVDGET